MSDVKAVVLHEADGKVTARVERVPESALPPGEVTVAVEYSTLNYKDGLILNGLGRLVRKYPHVPGVDFAGTVEASDSLDYRRGDKVILTGWRVGETQWGGYAEKARVKASQLVKLPLGRSARRVSPPCWR
jgi:acrylyl-CoA reductase (NADPH)